MKQNYTPYGASVDPSIVKEVNDINKKLSEESKKPDADKEKIMKLKISRLYKSMEMNNNIYSSNFRSRFPY